MATIIDANNNSKNGAIEEKLSCIAVVAHKRVLTIEEKKDLCSVDVMTSTAMSCLLDDCPKEAIDINDSGNNAFKEKCDNKYTDDEAMFGEVGSMTLQEFDTDDVTIADESLTDAHGMLAPLFRLTNGTNSLPSTAANQNSGYIVNSYPWVNHHPYVPSSHKQPQRFPHDQNDTYRYNMSHPRRGRCLIINNKEFDVDSGLLSRSGSDIDAESARRTFEKLGFDVKLVHNQSVNEMKSLVSRVSTEDHSSSDCMALVVMSHGSEGVVYGRDREVDFETLIEPLKGNRCPSLIGKPKLFIVQACRGDKFDNGTDTLPEDRSDGLDSIDSGQRLPQEADCLYAFSTVAGYYSWRSAACGSFFIQSLCTILDEFAATLDFVKILTRVNHEVATKYESYARSNPENHGKKQMPSVVSMLTKDLYFTAKRKPSVHTQV